MLMVFLGSRESYKVFFFLTFLGGQRKYQSWLQGESNSSSDLPKVQRLQTMPGYVNRNQCRRASNPSGQQNHTDSIHVACLSLRTVTHRELQGFPFDGTFPRTQWDTGGLVTFTCPQEECHRAAQLQRFKKSSCRAPTPNQNDSEVDGEKNHAAQLCSYLPGPQAGSRWHMGILFYLPAEAAPCQPICWQQLLKKQRPLMYGSTMKVASLLAGAIQRASATAN